MTEAALNWMLETGIAVTLLIGFILIIRRPFAKRFGARMTYALWALPVLRVFMPAIVLPALPEAPINEAAVPIYTVPAMAIPAQSIAEPAAPIIPWSLVILGLWMSGVVIWLGWQLFLQHQFRKTVTRESRELTDTVAQSAERIAARLGLKHLPEIRLSSEKIGPLVTGPVKPVIILPSDFEDNYSPSQQAFALGHELTHIRRFDLWAAFAGLIFRAVNWPNPLIHFAAGKFRADQEAACDASLLAQMGESGSAKHDYAETLLHAARRTVRLTQPRPLGLTIYHPLKERLMILNTQQTKASALSRVLATAMIASAIVISAPFTRAEGPADDKMAGGESEFIHEMSEKKVIKMVEEVDGVKTSKHYEIVTEDGKTTAWEIDEFGNKIEVPVESIDGLAMHGQNAFAFSHNGMSDQNMDIQVFVDGEGEGKHVIRKKMVLDMAEDVKGMDKAELQAFIEKHKGQNGTNVFAFSPDGAFDMNGQAFAWSTEGNHHAGLVTAAKRMTEKVEKSEDLTREQRRKLEKAVKALEEAQKALEE